MHIPDNMVANTICTLTSLASAGTVSFMVNKAVKSDEKPGVKKFAAVTALVFALQMLNFKIAGGTSGHIIGGTLAAGWLGTVFGVLSMVAVLFVQAFFFGDGGVLSLGANVFVMAIIGAGAGGLMREFLMKRYGSIISTISASFVSVILSSVACSAVVSLGSDISFLSMALPMVIFHSVTGLVEGVATSFMLELKEDSYSLPLAFSVAVAAVLISPLASSLPDGLESVYGVSGLIHNGAWFMAPMADYLIPGISGIFSGVAAGLAGIMILTAVSGIVSIPVLLKNR